MSGTWTTIEIAGKPADVFDPPAARPRFGTIFLHGTGLETLRSSAAYTQALAAHGLACVCPHGGVCWWTNRICPEFDPQITAERYLLDRVVPFFQERWQMYPRAIGLQGISMGGQGALRLAFKHGALFPVVAGVSSAIDYHELYGEGTPIDEMYDSKEACRQDTALLHVPPSGYPPHIYFCIDPTDARWIRGNDRLNEKLNALGIPHETDLTTRAGGHSWQYFDHMAPTVQRFIAEHLQEESRRLL